MEKLTLPKDYLSYSQINLWLTNKPMYRSIYYEGGKFPVNKGMIFGGEVSKLLEDNDPSVSWVPRYSNSEESITVDLGVVKITGKLDSFDPEHKKIIEYKTHSPFYPWTQKKVNEHKQLDIYSMMVEMRDGYVDDEVILYGLETGERPIVKTSTDSSGVVWNTSGETEMYLTQKISDPFRRVVTSMERELVKALLISVAHEIASDFQKWKSEPRVIWMQSV